MNTDVHLYENKYSYTNPKDICIRIYFHDANQNDMLSYISVFL